MFEHVLKQQSCTNVHVFSRGFPRKFLISLGGGFGHQIAMPGPMHERTIAAPIEFNGVGLHTGEQATLRILPAPPGKGVVFRRVIWTTEPGGCWLGQARRVSMTLMAKASGYPPSASAFPLYGLRDNAYVELDNFEFRFWTAR
jgi:hypothetical protein